VLNKKIYLHFDSGYVADGNCVEAYVYLKNNVFINSRLIKEGYACADRENKYDMRDKFVRLYQAYDQLTKIVRDEGVTEIQ